MRYFILFIIFSQISCQSKAQISPTLSAQPTDKFVGGGCDGCEQLYDFGDKILTNTDTLPEFSLQVEKLKLTGTIYQADGKTPAANIIMFIYHTDENGLYDTRQKDRKNYIFHRGWIKTTIDGKYTFYTFKPAPYPNRTLPRHIHPFIKEAGKTIYYIDDFNFVDDPLLTKEEREKLPLRGGSGIMKLRKVDGLWIGKRDIILGKNIPDY
ncbi:MAG: intradiol ring-cleavage dioxygenase [Saprospiraceae bacterium]